MKKAIDEIPCECDKLEKYHSKMKDLEERYKNNENQKYISALENKDDFTKKSFTHSKLDPNQYFPNIKTIKHKSSSTPFFSNKPNKNLVKEICKHLNKNEMLEVYSTKKYYQSI